MHQSAQLQTDATLATLTIAALYVACWLACWWIVTRDIEPTEDE